MNTSTNEFFTNHERETVWGYRPTTDTLVLVTIFHHGPKSVLRLRLRPRLRTAAPHPPDRHGTQMRRQEPYKALGAVVGFL